MYTTHILIVIESGLVKKIDLHVVNIENKR